MATADARLALPDSAVEDCLALPDSVVEDCLALPDSVVEDCLALPDSVVEDCLALDEETAVTTLETLLNLDDESVTAVSDCFGTVVCPLAAKFDSAVNSLCVLDAAVATVEAFLNLGVDSETVEEFSAPT